MQSLRENKADGYRGENRLFPQMKTSRKFHICLHWFLYPPDNVRLCKAFAMLVCSLRSKKFFMSRLGCFLD